MIRFLFMMFLTIACRDQASKNLYDPQKTYSSTVPEKEKQEADAKDGKKKPEDRLSPPVHISGTFLRCQAVDSNTEVSSDLGCKLINSENIRVLPEAIAEEVDYLLPIVEDPKVSVSLEKALEHEDLDVHFKFVSEDFLSLKAAINEVQLQVNFKRLVTGEASGYIQGQGPLLLAAPLKPWWQRELASDTNKDGQCQAGETCRFESSDLMWTKDEGAIYGHLGAVSLCDNLVDEYNDWRLPTENELHIAYAKQIMALNSSRFLNLKSARYWTSGDAPPNQKIAFDIETGQSLFRDIVDAFGVLCVRTIYKEP